MKLDQIYESVLYADDLERVESFYHSVLGLELIRSSNLMLAFQCGEGMLLVFDPGKAAQPGRAVPSHGSQGPGHLAFAVTREELEDWRQHLQAQGVEIEREVDWKGGAKSIYFRDPAGNSLELAVPTLWET